MERLDARHDRDKILTSSRRTMKMAGFTLDLRTLLETANGDKPLLLQVSELDEYQSSISFRSAVRQPRTIKSHSVERGRYCSDSIDNESASKRTLMRVDVNQTLRLSFERRPMMFYRSPNAWHVSPTRSPAKEAAPFSCSRYTFAPRSGPGP